VPQRSVRIGLMAWRRPAASAARGGGESAAAGLVAGPSRRLAEQDRGSIASEWRPRRTSGFWAPERRDQPGPL